MAMGNRPEVETAPAPIAALDVALGLQYVVSALGRLPFRVPLAEHRRLCPIWEVR